MTTLRRREHGARALSNSPRTTTALSVTNPRTVFQLSSSSTLDLNDAEGTTIPQGDNDPAGGGPRKRSVLGVLSGEENSSQQREQSLSGENDRGEAKRHHDSQSLNLEATSALPAPLPILHNGSFCPDPSKGGSREARRATESDGDSQLTYLTLPSTDEAERENRRERDERAGILMGSGEGMTPGREGWRNEEEQEGEWVDHSDGGDDGGNDPVHHQDYHAADPEEQDADEIDNALPFPPAQRRRSYQPRNDESEQEQEIKPPSPVVIWQKPQALLASFLKADRAVKTSRPVRRSTRVTGRVEGQGEDDTDDGIAASGSVVGVVGGNGQRREQGVNSEEDEELPEVAAAMDEALANRRRQGAKRRRSRVSSPEDGAPEDQSISAPPRRTSTRTKPIKPLQITRRSRSSSVDSMDIPIPPPPPKRRAKGKGEASGSKRRGRKGMEGSSSEMELPKRRPTLGKRAVVGREKKDQSDSSGESNQGEMKKQGEKKVVRKRKASTTARKKGQASNSKRGKVSNDFGTPELDSEEERAKAKRLKEYEELENTNFEVEYSVW